MPADPLGVAGQFGEQVAVPQHHGVAQQVGHDIDDAGLGDDVPDAPARLVPVDHVVVAPAGGHGLRQQVVDVGADLGDLGGRENVDGEEMAPVVVAADLGGRENLRVVDAEGNEAQVTLQFGESVGVLRHLILPAVRPCRGRTQVSRSGRAGVG